MRKLLRSRPNLVALLAIVALLWQGVVPLLATPRGQEVLAVICTAHGYQTLALPAGDAGGPATPRDRPGKVNCPLCSGASLDACLPGGASLQVALAELSPAQFLEPVTSTFGAPRYTLSLSRAPPFAA